MERKDLFRNMMVQNVGKHEFANEIEGLIKFGYESAIILEKWQSWADLMVANGTMVGCDFGKVPYRTMKKLHGLIRAFDEFKNTLQ